MNRTLNAHVGIIIHTCTHHIEVYKSLTGRNAGVIDRFSSLCVYNVYKRYDVLFSRVTTHIYVDGILYNAYSTCKSA